MTIMQLDKELKSVIEHYHVMGAECILAALVRACKGQQYLKADDIRRILNNVIEREEHESEVIAIDRNSIYPDIFVKHKFGGDPS